MKRRTNFANVQPERNKFYSATCNKLTDSVKCWRRWGFTQNGFNFFFLFTSSYNWIAHIYIMLCCKHENLPGVKILKVFAHIMDVYWHSLVYRRIWHRIFYQKAVPNSCWKLKFYHISPERRFEVYGTNRSTKNYNLHNQKDLTGYHK